MFLTEYGTNDDPHKATLACKIIETSKAPKDFVMKFLPREIDVLIRLNHPHLIHVHSIFQRKTKYYIFMRYSENGDLLGYILKNGCVSENQSRVWMRQLSLGLQYLHELEIVHRDIKCENVLLTANFNVKLSDFGFTRFCVDDDDSPILSETYCGSMSYAAPEILRGKPYLPKPTDLWSLGVVLFVMLNKSMPFDDTRMRKLYEQQMGKKYRFRSRVASIISLECKSVVKHLLEPDPGLRHTAVHVLNSDWVAMDSRLTSESLYFYQCNSLVAQKSVCVELDYCYPAGTTHFSRINTGTILYPSSGLDLYIFIPTYQISFKSSQ